MKQTTYEEENTVNEQGTVDEGALDSSEEAFMRGYNDDEDVVECPECGSAIDPEVAVSKELEGENLTFCSKTCAIEYEESMQSN